MDDKTCTNCLHEFTSAGACGNVNDDATLCRCEHIVEKCFRHACTNVRITYSDPLSPPGQWYCSIECYRES